MRNTEIASTDYWSSLGSIKRKGNKKRTKIIKPPFVFGTFTINKRYDPQRATFHVVDTFLLHSDSQGRFDLTLSIIFLTWIF